MGGPGAGPIGGIADYMNQGAVSASPPWFGVPSSGGSGGGVTGAVPQGMFSMPLLHAIAAQWGPYAQNLYRGTNLLQTAGGLVPGGVGPRPPFTMPPIRMR